MTENQLSSEAQEIVNAYEGTPYNADMYSSIAAVLYALADQVAPEDYSSFTGHVEYDQGLETRNDSIRESILTIANELNQF